MPLCHCARFLHLLQINILVLNTHDFPCHLSTWDDLSKAVLKSSRGLCDTTFCKALLISSHDSKFTPHTALYPLHESPMPILNIKWPPNFSKCFFYNMLNLVVILFKQYSSKLENGTLFTFFAHFVTTRGLYWSRRVSHLMICDIYTLWCHNGIL